ncbi:hypothetical protein D030_2399B, partial [Vibrio parahaemolyticus AQ3810]
KSKSD